MIGRIYKIIHSQSNICYIGSTMSTLTKRWQGHKNKFKTGINLCCIAKYFKRFGIDQFKIMLVKEYEVVDHKHLKVYEQLWVQKLSTLDQNNPFQIKRLSKKMRGQQYREKNRDLIKKHRESKKEITKQQQSQRYTCECGSEVQQSKKARHERTNKHLDRIAGQITPSQSQKYTCECSSEVQRGGKARHERTEKHLNFIVKS